MQRGLYMRAPLWRFVERPRHSCRWIRGFAGEAAIPVARARPLLQPPEVDGATIQVCTDAVLDLDLPSVPTISVIGPSRRGKSVLGCLLAGGDPGLFQQSHSSFKAMTSGTHVVEVPARDGGLPLRIVDTEGLSHIWQEQEKRGSGAAVPDLYLPHKLLGDLARHRSPFERVLQHDVVGA